MDKLNAYQRLKTRLFSIIALILFSCLLGPGHVHAQMPSESPFELVINNAHGEPTSNEATIPVTSMDYTLPLGLYYYYTGEEQTISLRLMASGGEDGSINMVQDFYPEGSGQNPTYSMHVDADELGETEPSVEWLGEEGYWSVQIPVPDTLNQDQDWQAQPWAQISVEVSSAHFDPFPAAMMITVMDIDPVALDETLNPDNSTVFSEIEDFTAITELAFDKWAIGHDDFSDQTKRLGTLVIDTELLQGVEPLNLCLLDQDHQPVTAQALMNLQDNMDIAAATMSLATAEEGMTGFGKPSRLTMYNLEFEETPGVLYVTDEGEEVTVVEQDSGEILDSDRIAQYIWDPETRTLTLDVTNWSTYKAFYETETSALEEVAGRFDLHQNYPNPFNPSTQIHFTLPEQAHVRLTVYNMLGQQVETLLNETRQAGRHEVTFDATGLSSGAFIYRIEAGEYVNTRQMMMVK